MTAALLSSAVAPPASAAPANNSQTSDDSGSGDAFAARLGAASNDSGSTAKPDDSSRADNHDVASAHHEGRTRRGPRTLDTTATSDPATTAPSDGSTDPTSADAVTAAALAALTATPTPPPPAPEAVAETAPAVTEALVAPTILAAADQPSSAAGSAIALGATDTAGAQGAGAATTATANATAETGITLPLPAKPPVWPASIPSAQTAPSTSLRMPVPSGSSPASAISTSATPTATTPTAAVTTTDAGVVLGTTVTAAPGSSAPVPVPTLSPLPTAQTPTAPGDPTAVDVISPAGFTLPVLPKAERARPAAAAPTATPIDSTIAVLPAAPLTAARPVAAPTAAASAPVEVPTAQQQVAGAIASLRTAADGTHHIVLQLHPEDLGPVNIVARLSHGDLSISLATTGDAARAALHDGVSQLRDDLHQAGFTGVAVSVDAGDAGDASARGERFGTFANDRASGRAGDSPTTADTQPRTRSISSRDGVDRWL